MHAKYIFSVIGTLIAGTAVGFCNPLNPQVVSGAATFSSSANSLTVNQSTPQAIINWDSFSIQAGEVTRFNHLAASASTLNRVITADPSSIHGQLTANGSVYLINPNGILVGSTGVVDVGGSFLASTLDVPDSEYLAGGNLTFSGTSSSSVVSMGSITAQSGDIFLLGGSVNNSGTLSAANGTVGLAAGEQIMIAATGDERVFVTSGSSGRVDHSGALAAQVAELKANGIDPNTLAVNIEGVNEASNVHTVGGRIYLSAGEGLMRISAPVRSEYSPGQAGKAEVNVDAGNIEIVDTEIVAIGPSENVDVSLEATGQITATTSYIGNQPRFQSGGVNLINSIGHGSLGRFSGGIDVTISTVDIPLILGGTRIEPQTNFNPINFTDVNISPAAPVSSTPGGAVFFVTSEVSTVTTISETPASAAPSTSSVMAPSGPLATSVEEVTNQHSAVAIEIDQSVDPQIQISTGTGAVNVQPPAVPKKATVRNLKQLFDPTGSRNFIETKISR